MRLRDRLTCASRAVLALTLAGVLAVTAASGDEGAAPYPPPAPRVESPAPSPSPDAVWIAGFWVWRSGQWAWTSGRWEGARGRVYVPGRYKQTSRGWIREPGRWQP